MTGILLLSGCSSMLERDYSVVSPHPEHPITEQDSSTIRAETYQDLVSAVLYLVSQHTETGSIRLVNYTDDVEADLARACLEVATEDPLGCYAVDYIKHDYSRVVTTYEANIYIMYSKTKEQVQSIASVTGSNAIREELQTALTAFAPEVVLRVGYFAEDEVYIAQLIRQAYYNTPEAALGMPVSAITLYPESGRQRIVEITLSYSGTVAGLKEKQQALQETAAQITAPLQDKPVGLARITALQDVFPSSVKTRAEGGATAWDALCGDGADSEGTALALALLCGNLECTCTVTEGTHDGAPVFFCILSPNADTVLYADFSRDEAPQLYQEAEFTALGYAWNASDTDH